MDSYATYDESSLRALAEPMVPQDIESVSYKRKDKLYINDSNNGSYSSGEITFDLRTIKDDLVLWRDAYIRGTVRVKATGAVPYTADSLIAFRSGAHGLFDRLRVDINDASTVNSNGLSISNRLSELMEKTTIDADSCSNHWGLDYPVAGRLPSRAASDVITGNDSYLTYEDIVTPINGTALAGNAGVAINNGDDFADVFTGAGALTTPYGTISFTPGLVLVGGTTTRAQMVANMVFTPNNSSIAGVIAVVAGAAIVNGDTGDVIATYAVLNVELTSTDRTRIGGLGERQGWFQESAVFDAVDSFFVPVQIPLRKICDLFDKMREPIANVYFKLTLSVAGPSSSHPFQTVRGVPQPDLEPSVLLTPRQGNSWRLYYDKVYLRPTALKLRNKMLASKQAHFIQYRDSKLITVPVTAPSAGSHTIELSPGIKACRYVYIMTQARVHPSPAGDNTSGARVKASTVSLYSGLTSDVPLTNFNLLIDNNQIYARDISTDEEAYALYRECSPFGFDLDKVGILSYSVWRRRYRILCFDLTRNNASWDPAKSVQIQFRYEIQASNAGGLVYSDYALGDPIPFDMYAVLSYDASATINEGTGAVISVDQ